MGVSLWMAAAQADVDEATLAQRLAAVLAVTAELGERLATAGTTTIHGAFGLHRRLVNVLGSVDTDRLNAMHKIVADLEVELRFAACVLARLRDIKRVVDETTASPPLR